MACRRSSASDNAKLCAKNFSENSNLDDLGISWVPVSPLELTWNHNLDSSKVSGPDCIPVVVLKNCEPELSCIITELFNMCLKGSSFPDCCKVSLVVPIFKNVWERSIAKNYCHVSLLSVISEIFEKLVIGLLIT